jgi:hypothetical protein
MNKRLFLLLGAAGLSAVAVAVDPPFNENVRFHTSSRYVRGDWIERLYGDHAVITAMDRGLQLQVQASSGENRTISITQHRRSFTPASGITARARFRGVIEHIPGTEGRIGFWSKVDSGENPWDDEPAAAAYFDAKRIENETPLEVRGVVCGNGGCDTTDVLFSWSKCGGFCFVYYDFVVEVNGTSNVTFYWREAGETEWNDETLTGSHLPDGPMHFSLAARENPEAPALNNMTAKIYEFEIGAE